MIRHILSDGREVSSIEGYVVPATGMTAAVYSVVAGIIMGGSPTPQSKSAENVGQKLEACG